jgi:hypothetical protein
VTVLWSFQMLTVRQAIFSLLLSTAERQVRQDDLQGIGKGSLTLCSLILCWFAV